VACGNRHAAQDFGNMSRLTFSLYMAVGFHGSS
jgi:hypothetical protein